MTSEQPGRGGPDQRSSFRILEAEPRRQAVLKIGPTEIPVLLLDESAGGFAVLAKQHAGIEVEVGQVAVLSTAGGSYRVRLVHLAEQAADATGWRGGGPRFRLGLERLQEVDDTQDKQKTIGWLNRLFPRGRVAPRVSAIMVVIGLTLVAVAIPLTAAVKSRPQRSFLEWVALWEDSAKRCWPLRRSSDGGPSSGSTAARRQSPAPDATPFGSAEAWARQSPKDAPTDSRQLPTGSGSASGRRPGARPPARKRADHPTTSAVRPPTAGSSETWLATVRRLPGASVFLLTEVVEHLGLSDLQQEEIRQIVDSTDEKLQQIATHWQNATRGKRSKIRTMLLGEARRRALEVLNEEQLALWRALESDDPE